MKTPSLGKSYQARERTIPVHEVYVWKDGHGAWLAQCARCPWHDVATNEKDAQQSAEDHKRASDGDG